MSFAVTVSSPSLLLLLPKKSYFRSYPKFLTFRNLNPLQASRGTSNFPQVPFFFFLSRSFSTMLTLCLRNYYFLQGSESLVDDPRNWSRRISQRFDEDYGDNDDEEDDEEEEDRSLDLLVRFVENVFNKVSRRARKAARSVLPLSISIKLVRNIRLGSFLMVLFGCCFAFIVMNCDYWNLGGIFC